MKRSTSAVIPLTLCGLVLGAGAAPGQAPDRCPDPLPLYLYDYDAAAPLNARDSLLAVEDGIEVRAFAFDSPRGGSATGILAVPRRTGPHAGIVYLTGFPVRPEGARATAVALARHGAVVALLWAPSSRPDGAGKGSPVTFTPADSAHQVQFVVDVRRTVDLLLARPDVDPGRLALFGASLGGTVGAHVAGVEPRLKAVALQSANAGSVSYFTGPGGPGLPEDLPAEERDAWLRAMAPVQSACYVGRAAMPILMQHGRQDALVTPGRAEQLHAAVRGPGEVRWYDAGHGLDPQAVFDRLAWLHRQVGTDAPTPAAGAPER